MPEIDLAASLLHLSRLEAMTGRWRHHAQENSPSDNPRVRGYLAGLELCADQADEILRSIRADLVNGR